jgi:hypothetical protein
MFAIIKQPSSWAGFGLIFSGLATLVQTKGTDSQAWAQVVGGVMSVALPEQGAQVK